MTCVLTSLLTILLLFPLSALPIANNTPSENEQCDEFLLLASDFIANQTSNVTHINTTMSHDIDILLTYSGHSINDLGDYDDCKTLPDQHYLLAELTTSSLDFAAEFYGSYLGLCVPKYCSHDYLNSITSRSIEILRGLKVPGLADLNIVYIKPKTNTKTDFWLYFTIAILSIFGLLVIIGTYLSKFVPHDEHQPRSLKILSRNLNESSARGRSVFRKSSLDKSKEEHNESIYDQEELQVSFSRLKASTYLMTRPKLVKLCECFDLHTNINQLFKCQKDATVDQNLYILDGIRTLGLIGVIYSHTFLNATVSKNEFAVDHFATSPKFLIVLAATFSVDIFFLLNGFLQGIQLTEKLKEMPIGLESYLRLIGHRWLRIVPTYFIVILLYWKVGIYLGDGPLWYQYSSRTTACFDLWWRNILFLDNILASNSTHYCYSWGWYLACDFQMFLLAPFLGWIYLKRNKRAYRFLFFLLLVALGVGYWEAIKVNFKYTLSLTLLSKNYWSDFYSNTIVRMSTYLGGLYLGLKYKAYKSGDNENLFASMNKRKKWAYLTSLFGLILTVFIIYFPRTVQTGTIWPDWFNFLWQVIDRPLLAIGVFLTFLPGLFGLLRPIKEFLSSYIFILCSKLSYCAYLVHPLVITIVYKSQPIYLGFSFAEKNQLTIAFVILSMVIGGLLHLFVEMPLANLEIKFPKRYRSSTLYFSSYS